MAKSIISVGFEIPGHRDSFLSLDSDQSLLDYDIVVFTPDISSLFGYGCEQYQGKPCLSDNASFTLREKAQRWRQELLNAFDHGKTIFLFLPELQGVFVATGTQTYSGIGRNLKTTRQVEPFNNYSIIPVVFEEVVSGRGREIKPAKDLGMLSPYWKEFGSASQYQVYFSSKMVVPLLVTKSGGKTVGGIARGKADSGKGSLVLLPQLLFDEDEFTTEEDGGIYWTKEAVKFGKQLVSALVEIERALNSERQKTPTPVWVKSPEFRLQKESVLEKQISGLSAQVEKLQTEKQTLLNELEQEASLRRLLYETGPALEDAILEALNTLGVKAERFKDGESEFDAVFTWGSQRLLGEAEGKDTKAVNVDKIGQLERNLGEDFSRDGVTQYAKGVLFGNAFRLTALSERDEYFTEKCVSTARRIKAALVRTPDLFIVTRYVKESGDKEFSRKCIEAIMAAEGTVVVFPPVPNKSVKIVVETKPENATS
ncbi:MAG: hypothetical protein WCV00_01860 [Verrucomicrobiia bacterium]|jgi:hypothetical protein